MPTIVRDRNSCPSCGSMDDYKVLVMEKASSSVLCEDWLLISVIQVLSLCNNLCFFFELNSFRVHICQCLERLILYLQCFVLPKNKI